MWVQCAWDGPNPTKGEWICGKRGGVLKIRDVRARPGQAERLLLELEKPRAGQTLPPDAVLHPYARYQPHDAQGPARSRQTAHDGVSAVVAARWVDPDDNRPSARGSARTVRGWRAYCPLRRARERKGSLLTERHVAAADILRRLWDLARLGPTDARAAGLAGAEPGPRSGPPTAAQVQARAANDLRIALALFSPVQLRMLEIIVLRCASIYAWCILEAEHLHLPKPLDQRVELGRLIAVLDILAQHWRDEVDAALFGNVVL
jgi:hypothetical protein